MRKGLNPVQPFFVNNTTKYYKKMMPQTPFVHFYAFTADATTGSATEPLSAAIPDGCADLLFTDYNGRQQGFVYGFVTKPNSLNLDSGTRCFGVRFRPGYLPSRLGVSLPEVANSRISLDALPGGKQLVENVSTAENFLEKVKLIQDYASDQWLHNSLLLQIISIIEESDSISVAELEKLTLYSARYINRIFVDNLGLSPKAFAKCVRFQRLINLLNNDDCPCFSDIAALMGYFDQSHFYKEFKEFAAITPGEYHNAVNIANYKQKFVYI